jgi:hypothetical protein
MYVAYPTVIVPLVIAAIFEMWLVFVLAYATLNTRGERHYWTRVRDVIRFRLR